MVTPLQPELEARILSQEYMEMVTPHQSGLRNQISMEYGGSTAEKNGEREAVNQKPSLSGIMLPLGTKQE